MSMFQFILVGVTALFMVGRVLVSPTSAAPAKYISCTLPGTPPTLNVTGLDVSPYPTPNFQDANITVNARTDHEIRGGRIRVAVYSPAAVGFYDLCEVTPLPCPIAAGDFVISISLTVRDTSMTGRKTVYLTILNEEGDDGPCVAFYIPVLLNGEPMLKLAAN